MVHTTAHPLAATDLIAAITMTLRRASRPDYKVPQKGVDEVGKRASQGTYCWFIEEEDSGVACKLNTDA